MLLFTMIAVAVALPEACGPPPGAAPKYYISFNGSDITGDGSRENPFASPQGACFVLPGTEMALYYLGGEHIETPQVIDNTCAVTHLRLYPADDRMPHINTFIVESNSTVQSISMCKIGGVGFSLTAPQGFDSNVLTVEGVDIVFLDAKRYYIGNVTNSHVLNIKSESEYDFPKDVQWNVKGLTGESLVIAYPFEDSFIPEQTKSSVNITDTTLTTRIEVNSRSIAITGSHISVDNAQIASDKLLVSSSTFTIDPKGQGVGQHPFVVFARNVQINSSNFLASISPLIGVTDSCLISECVFNGGRYNKGDTIQDNGAGAVSIYLLTEELIESFPADTKARLQRSRLGLNFTAGEENAIQVKNSFFENNIGFGAADIFLKSEKAELAKTKSVSIVGNTFAWTSSAPREVAPLWYASKADETPKWNSFTIMENQITGSGLECPNNGYSEDGLGKCRGGGGGDSKKDNTALIVGLVVGIVGAIILLGGIAFVVRRYRRRAQISAAYAHMLGGEGDDEAI
ncbi:hypothetical protein AAMO2058_000687400 [Amorphochlora amoebiformis]